VSVTHVVLWRLHDASQAPRFRAELERCASLVEGTLAYEVGIRSEGLAATADVALVARFVDAAALDAYQRHPTHVAVSAVLAPLRASREVLDFVS
jgi:quinol monooxygenase YgiN